MTQRDYFLRVQVASGLRIMPLHVDCALEALEAWTNAVRVSSGTNGARAVSCFSMVGNDPATRQDHWEITLYSPGLF